MDTEVKTTAILPKVEYQLSGYTGYMYEESHDRDDELRKADLNVTFEANTDVEAVEIAKEKVFSFLNENKEYDARTPNPHGYHHQFKFELSKKRTLLTLEWDAGRERVPEVTAIPPHIKEVVSIDVDTTSQI